MNAQCFWSVRMVAGIAGLAIATLSASFTQPAMALNCPSEFVENNQGHYDDIGQIGVLEIDDAGQSLNDAQVIANCDQPLDFIDGELSNSSDVDLFKIVLTGASPFSASLYMFSPGYALNFDSQLFLFSETGAGVVTNDDHALTPGETYPIKTYDGASAISEISSLLLPAGTYYLGISAYDNDPIGSEGELFPDTPYQGVNWAKDFGSDTPQVLQGWTGGGWAGSEYIIQLTGSRPVEVNNTVPEPDTATGLLVAVGVGAIAQFKKRALRTR